MTDVETTPESGPADARRPKVGVRGRPIMGDSPVGAASVVPPELRRDAQLLRRARGLAAVALPLLLWAEPTTGVPAPLMPPVPFGILMGAVLLLVNLLDPTVTRALDRQSVERWAAVEVALDTVVMGSVVWLVALDPTSSLWVLLLLPVIEAALRFRVRGLVAASLAMAAVYAGRDLVVSLLYEEVGFGLGVVVQRIAALWVVALAAGSLEERLATGALQQRRVRVDAERRSSVMSVVAEAAAEMTTLDLSRVRSVLHRAIERLGATGKILSPEAPVPPDHLGLAIMTNGHLRGRIAVATPVSAEVHGALELLAAQTGAVIGQAEAFIEAERLRQELEHRAYHDPLTGLRNRAAFDIDLRSQSERRRPPGDGLAVLFIDLDGFKAVNDRLGHESGDVLLEAVARRLESCVRPEDLVARLGGDEFTVLLPGANDVDGALVVAERILDRLDEPFELAGTWVRLSASIGVAFSATEGAHPEHLVRQADEAMYEAKRGGRSRVVVFGAERRQRALR